MKLKDTKIYKNAFYPFNLYRTHRESLKKLRKVLSDSSKEIRHRRHLINIHIALLQWLTEFSAFFLIFLGSFILGHGNADVTMILQSFTIFICFNVLPCIYLINDSELKAEIAETKLYFNFLKVFKCEKVDPSLLKRGGDNCNIDVVEESNENDNS